MFYLKGNFPYEYFTDSTKFDETALPPKSAFYNRLTDEHISDEDYERRCKSGVIFHEIVQRVPRLVLGVLLLADVFEKFRHAMLNAHGLDCLHFPSLPSMTLQMALKVTGVELELVSDANIYPMIESGIRGGFF